MSKSKLTKKALTGLALGLSIGAIGSNVQAEETSTTGGTLIIETDGGKNDNVVIEEPKPTPPPSTDGSLDDVIIEEPKPTPPSTDGSLDDVVIEEPKPTPPPSTDGSLDDVIIEEPKPTPPSTDGSLDDVIIEEPKPTPPPSTDGSKPSSDDKKEDESKKDKEKQEGQPTKPSSNNNPKKPNPTNRPTTNQANQQGKSQVGTFSEETGQIVSDVSVDNPIVTDTGYTIVSTENSNVVVENADGTRSTVSAEQVGGEVNKDGTVSVKNKDGELTTLPQTGSKEVAYLSILGMILLLFAFQKARPNKNLKKLY